MIKEYRGELLRLLIGIIISIISLIYPAFKLVFILLGFAILAYPLFLKTFKGILKGNNIIEILIILIVTISSLYLNHYYEAIIITVIYQLSLYFKNIILILADKEVSKIINLKTDYANLKLEDNIISIKLERIRVDDIIIVNPNEVIPLDGIIVKGISKVDNSIVKSNTDIHEVTVNDEVISGSYNLSSTLEIRVTKLLKNTTLTNLLKMLPQKTNTKIPLEKLVNLFYRYYLIGTILLFFIFIIVAIFSESITFNDNFYNFLAILLLTNCWSLLMIIPFNYTYSFNLAIKKGLFIKKRSTFNLFATIKTIIFDVDNDVSDIIPILEKNNLKAVIFSNKKAKKGKDNIYYNLSLDSKREEIIKLKENNNLIYVGLDLSLMKLTNLGITLNTANQALLEEAQIVINNNDLKSIGEFINIACHTKESIIVNMILAISVKIGCFILCLLGLLSLWLVSIIEMIVMIIVIFNTLKITQKKEI